MTDRHGAFVNGLPKDAFALSENGIGQQISTFSEEDAPVSIGIFTHDLDGIVNRVTLEPAAGSTALIDAVWMSLGRLRFAKNARKALVIISDGMGNNSRHSRKELLERAKAHDRSGYRSD